MGKSELINSLLERPAAKTNAFTEATKRIRVRKGLLHGIQVRTRVRTCTNGYGLHV